MDTRRAPEAAARTWRRTKVKERKRAGWRSWSEVSIAPADRAGWRQSFDTLCATLREEFRQRRTNVSVLTES